MPNHPDRFRKVAARASQVAGSPWAFSIAVGSITGWLLCGPMFDFSDTWQLVINTGTTIVTFLMVFLIQNTQNRDAKALQLKLDELIYATKGARNSLIDLEDLTEEELDLLQKEFVSLRHLGEKVHHHGTRAIEHEVRKRKDKGKGKKK